MQQGRHRPAIFVVSAQALLVTAMGLLAVGAGCANSNLDLPIDRMPPDGSIDAGEACRPGPDPCNGRDDDCDGETDELPDADESCSLDHATGVCQMGACAVVSCHSGYTDCDGEPDTGCESDITLPEDCGECGHACDPSEPFCATAPSGEKTCVSNCHAPTATRCGDRCVDDQSDPRHCGGCDAPCALANAIAGCTAGSCTVGMCNEGWGDCDGMADNGCETPLDTLTDCGGCGMPCVRDQATATCATGMCAVAECATGHGNCDGMDENGCETSLDSLTDCGGCGVPCALDHADASCGTGSCRLMGCDGGYYDCDGVDGTGCEATLDTLTNCGGCMIPCALDHASESCATSTCALTACDPGYDNCDGRSTTGCETSLRTVTHCGRCGTPCSLSNATESCATGSCLIEACSPDHGNCDGMDSTGCEADLRASTTDCGRCGHGCRAGVDCLNGICADERILSISAADFHTCAAQGLGQAYCWGHNGYGQLGDGSATNRGRAVTVSGVTDATYATAGWYHSCVRQATGEVACWGLNTNGQLGVGDLSSRRTPTTVTGLSDATTVEARHAHTCAIRRTGQLVCWGDNAEGQLGDGTMLDRNAPVAVPGMTNVVAVALGDFHTCAVLQTGAVACWGKNNEGQLGDGTMTRRTTPTAVMGITDATQIATGETHTCAVHGAAGYVSCWGNNAFGRLGDGSTLRRLTPVRASGLSGVVEVGVGYYHSCARRATGTVTCWGYNYHGQLGDGTWDTRYTGTVNVIGVTDAVDIGIGRYHSCVIRATGAGLCFGQNLYQQIGDNTTAAKNRPTAVLDLPGTL